ncbi:MAG TPA: AI-2E family transporter, partial [Candidatus Polarisedimenticolia bacterium]|nr:AI-2E family transporter [Candidatus Polarisedimenticolia bacterium]
MAQDAMSSAPIPATAANPDPTAGESANRSEEALIMQGTPTSDATRSTVRMSVDARGLALGILATVAVVLVLKWAQSFVISLMLGIFFSYTLNPLVGWLERIKIPRVLGAIVVLVAVVCALVLGVYSLRGQIQTIIEQVPE